MSGPVVQRQQGTPVDRSGSSGLGDVVELILDKGLVIDAFVQVSLIGIEVLTIEARIIVASVDTYLRYAQAINGIDLARDATSAGLPEPIGQMPSFAAGKEAAGVTAAGLNGTRGDVAKQATVRWKGGEK
jgi:gas vesicle structural protein